MRLDRVISHALYPLKGVGGYIPVFSAGGGRSAVRVYKVLALLLFLPFVFCCSSRPPGLSSSSLYRLHLFTFFVFFVCFLLLVARCVHQSLTARTTWPYPPQSRENWTPQLQNRTFFWCTFRLRTSQTQRVREAWPRRALKRLLF